MADIFLSYSTKDREIAARVVTVLSAAGWSVYWDRHIPAGSTWRGELEKAIGSMRCMVVLWSSHSVDSRWVCEEANIGSQRNKLVPVLIELVEPPLGFREIQAADLCGWDGDADSAAIQPLVSDVRRILGATPDTTTHATTHAATRTETTEQRERRQHPEHFRPLRTRLPMATWIAIGIAVIAVGAAIWSGYIASLASRVADPAQTPAKTAQPTPAVTPPPVPAETPQVVTTPTPSPAVPPLPALPPPSPPAVAKALPPSTNAKPATTPPTNRAYCSNMLQRLELGEPLDASERARYAKECQR
jgi:TIR domain